MIHTYVCEFLVVNSLQSTVKALESRLVGLEKKCTDQSKTSSIKLNNVPQVPGKDNKADDDDDDDDVDLFGSDSDGEDDAAAKVREERLAAYAAKKSKSK